MSRNRRILVLAGCFALWTSSASSQEAPDFVDIFANAETVQIDGQVAGTYDVKNELLVKIRNNDQFAVPMAAGADLGAYPKNMLVRVSITEGAVVDVRKAEKAEPSVTFETDSAWADVEGAPADALVRRVTLTAKLEHVDHEAGKVTVVAPYGETTELHVKPPSVLKDLGIANGEVADLTYFEIVDVDRR